VNKKLVKEPMYQQLNQILRDLVLQEEYKAGDKFLTERAVCERFGVSRATANKALSNLVSEGILEFRKGVGTFVKGMVLDYNLRGLVSFTEKMKQLGKHPENVVIHFRKQKAEEAGKMIMKELDIPSEEELIYFKRLRLADGIPFIIERRFLIARYCPTLTAKMLKESLYVILSDRYELSISREKEIIKAISIEKKDAELLKVKSGMAGFIMFVTGYLEGDNPLWSAQILYRGDCYELHNEYSVKGTVSPVKGVWLEVKDI
jgi:GntR family transcriptional regulator